MSTLVDSTMGIENALEFDLTQRDSESEVTIGTCSDTESCVDVPNNRRLRLVWDPSVPDPLPQWHPEARAVEGLFHTLASRIRAVPAGSEVPRAVRTQRWSPVNVPLIWTAWGSADSTPALDWLIVAVGQIVEAVVLYEGKMPARDAVREGWSALRQVLRVWGIEEPNHLTTWLRGRNVSGQPHLCKGPRVHHGRGQSRRRTSRLLEGVYVQLAIHMGRELVAPQPHPITGACGLRTQRDSWC